MTGVTLRQAAHPKLCVCLDHTPGRGDKGMPCCGWPVAGEAYKLHGIACSAVVNIDNVLKLDSMAQDVLRMLDATGVWFAWGRIGTQAHRSCRNPARGLPGILSLQYVWHALCLVPRRVKSCVDCGGRLLLIFPGCVGQRGPSSPKLLCLAHADAKVLASKKRELQAVLAGLEEARTLAMPFTTDGEPSCVLGDAYS
jgi:hypothetical protein